METALRDVKRQLDTESKQFQLQRGASCCIAEMAVNCLRCSSS